MEEHMLRVFKIGSAFIGIIVGAGFASGQEILQYFTSFGYWGTVGALLSTVLFAYLGMTLTRVGSKLQTSSHKEAIYKISGKYLGILVDAVIVITLFGVGVVMVAGAGSTMKQQFDMPVFLGSLIMIILMIATMLLKVDLVVVVVSIYSLTTMDTTFEEMEPFALEQPTAFPNWFIAAVNYASFNIAVGAGMSIVMGGSEKNTKVATIGGLLGGLGIGVLIL